MDDQEIDFLFNTAFSAKDDPGAEFAAGVMRRVRKEAQAAPFWRPAGVLVAAGALAVLFNLLWASGFRLAELADAWDWLGTSLARSWDSFNPSFDWLMNLVQSAAEQSSTNLSAWLPYAPLLAALAAVLILVAHWPRLVTRNKGGKL